MAYSVEQRTQEIGIRLALGAPAAHVGAWWSCQGMALALVGVVHRPGAAFWLAKLIATFLFGVTAKDPLVFVGVPLLADRGRARRCGCRRGAPAGSTRSSRCGRIGRGWFRQPPLLVARRVVAGSTRSARRSDGSAATPRQPRTAQGAAVRERIELADAKQLARKDCPDAGGEQAAGGAPPGNRQAELSDDRGDDVRRTRAECDPHTDFLSSLRDGKGDHPAQPGHRQQQRADPKRRCNHRDLAGFLQLVLERDGERLHRRGQAGPLGARERAIVPTKSRGAPSTRTTMTSSDRWGRSSGW